MNSPAEVSRVDVLAVFDDLRWFAHSAMTVDDQNRFTEARAAVAELIEREAKLREYIAAIKVQATEAPACDADRLRLVVMYCDDAARLTAEQEAKE